MKTKSISLDDIINFLGEDCISVHGKIEQKYIDNLAPTESINEKSLDWIKLSAKNKQDLAEKSKAKALLVDTDVVYSESIKSEEKVLIVVKDPKCSLAQIGNNYFVDNKVPFIHPTAIIDSNAIIGENVSIGAYSIIGNCAIGDNSVIDSHVQIYDGTQIGKHCYIKSGAVLGGAGFGYEKDDDGNHFRFPQIGALLIGDYVEIGANTCIDRGALADTVIGDYTKINNLCHIAHNNKIGNNVIITAQVNISGSNIIEDNTWIAPNSSIRGWLKIGKNSTVGMGAVVVKDIPENEVWVGNPAKHLIK